MERWCARNLSTEVRTCALGQSTVSGFAADVTWQGAQTAAPFETFSFKFSMVGELGLEPTKA